VLVEQEPSRETRRRLVERKTIPNGLDCSDAEGGAALGDPVVGRIFFLSFLSFFFSPFFSLPKPNVRLLNNGIRLSWQL
jgi:hypothetical protein